MTTNRITVQFVTNVAVFKELSKICFNLTNGLLLTLVAAYATNKLTWIFFISLICACAMAVALGIGLLARSIRWESVLAEHKDD